jgi:hypothetical protein
MENFLCGAEPEVRARPDRCTVGELATAAAVTGTPAVVTGAAVAAAAAQEPPASTSAALAAVAATTATDRLVTGAS